MAGNRDRLDLGRSVSHTSLYAGEIQQGFDCGFADCNLSSFDTDGDVLFLRTDLVGCEMGKSFESGITGTTPNPLCQTGLADCRDA